MPKSWLYNAFQLPGNKEEKVLNSEVEYYKKKKKGVGVLQSRVTWTWTHEKGDKPVAQGTNPKPPFFWGKPLREVAPGDDLILNAHGATSRVAIGYYGGYETFQSTNAPQPTKENMFRTVTAEKIAELIFMDGLSLSHIFIKLNSCYGAGGGELGNKDADTSFAAVLAKELGLLGYTQIRVGGFPGKHSRNPEKNSYGQKNTNRPGKLETSSERILSKGHRIWFNKDGETILKDGSKPLP